MCELSAVRFSIVSPLSVNQQPYLERVGGTFLLESMPDAVVSSEHLQGLYSY